MGDAGWTRVPSAVDSLYMGDAVKPKVIKLKPGEDILAVVPEMCAGPGWANQVVWVHISNGFKQYRTESLQWEEQTERMKNLFNIGSSICLDLAWSVPVEKYE
jgi:hypothetical protein